MEALDAIAPPEWAEDWDNSGIQLLCSEAEVERVLICLDVTQEVLEEANRVSAQWIVSHHPLLFEPLGNLDIRTPLGRKVAWLIQHQISVYSAHMTYDKAPWGNSGQLANRLQLKDKKPLPGAGKGTPEDWSYLTGNLPKGMTVTELIHVLETDGGILPGAIKVAGPKDVVLHKVAVVAGSGGDLLQTCIAEQCQCLITGDVKYHQALEGVEAGLVVVDAGHFATEVGFVESFAQELQQRTGNQINIIKSKATKDPWNQ